MSTAPDGASRSTDPARTASPRRSARVAAEATAKRPRTARPAPSGSRSSRSGAARSAKPAGAGRRIDWFGWGSVLIPIAALPVSFFVWYVIISLGSYPNDQKIGDLIVGLLLTALFHAVILLGILFAIASIRAARRAARVGVLGWIGVVLGALVLIYWELLVSPWLVALWNTATGTA